MGVEKYLPDEWRLFVDSNKKSPKCVLIYNRKEYSPDPIGCSIHVTQKQEEIKMV